MNFTTTIVQALQLQLPRAHIADARTHNRTLFSVLTERHALIAIPLGFG